VRCEDPSGARSARVRAAGGAGLGIASPQNRPGAIAEPKIPTTLAQFVLESGDELEELERVSIEGAALGGVDVQSWLLAESRLTKVDLTESRLARLQVTDVEFEACNFSNAKMPGAAYRRVLVSRSKLSGVQIDAGTFTDVEFRGCRFDFASFSGVKFRQVAFRDCLLREADFSNVSLERVQFIDCDLTRATLSRMRIDTSEMRRCTLTELRQAGELRGIAMDWNDILENAALFASELGIIATQPG
jgi:uncharacterized protein YjbI with pentapeptide repeats